MLPVQVTHTEPPSTKRTAPGLTTEFSEVGVATVAQQACTLSRPVPSAGLYPQQAEEEEKGQGRSRRSGEERYWMGDVEGSATPGLVLIDIDPLRALKISYISRGPHLLCFEFWLS
ncbi:hypothetical protein NHX12_030505 [Muraenolepis orangiensis]|uniref:Uncharacterized protein n=1 Tax=Muraenolepis orangiensis TaxID=630683 RepID=A0A9Q0IJF9_9TELE|nr:hypothetical protein NHX12_030505 [Muraenolepis orangiensis]